MTQPDKMREAFEAWAKTEEKLNLAKSNLPKPARHYTQIDTEWAFSGWQAAIAQATAAQWMPIETAPHGRKLIVGYHNKLGNWRTVMASYYAEETLPTPDYYHGDKEFADAGWFEECESNDEVIYPCEEEPTHWMPLPPPPATASGTDPAEVVR